MDVYAYGRIIVTLVCVIGLILMMAWVAKLNVKHLGGHGKSELRIAARLPLGPRGSQVVVLDTAQSRLILGVNQGQITVLERQDPVAAAASPASSGVPQKSRFADVLGRFAPNIKV